MEVNDDEIDVEEEENEESGHEEEDNDDWLTDPFEDDDTTVFCAVRLFFLVHQDTAPSARVNTHPVVHLRRSLSPPKYASL